MPPDISSRRTDRLNSLLKEVIAEVILKEVKNPHLPSFITITGVEIAKDLRHAKVFVSVLGDKIAQTKAVAVLQEAKGFISMRAAAQIVIRFFPELTFYLDDSAEKQMQIDTLISEIQKERTNRGE